jgi:hypothetical protein
MIDGQDSEKVARKASVKMRDEYENFLQRGQKIHCPREAHLFALAMRFKGESFGRTGEQVVMELEGELPSYWTDPAVVPL